MVEQKSKFTKAEAVDILAQCRLLQESIDALCRQANEALAPKLRLVKDDESKTV